MEVSPLILNIVRYTSMLIAALAANNRRANIRHIESQIFLEIRNQLTRRLKVCDSVVSEMFGLPYATYRARLSPAEREYKDSLCVNNNAWYRLVQYLRKQHDWHLVEDIIKAHENLPPKRRIEERIVRGILREMHKLCLVEHKGGLRKDCYYRWSGSPEELLDPSLIALIRQHIFRFGPINQEAIQEALGLDHEDVEPILTELLNRQHISKNCDALDCRYTCNGLYLGLPSADTLDAAFLDHYQSMVLALVDKVTGCTDSRLPPVGGSTYTFELWPGHPCEGRVRELFDRCRRDMSELRRELQNIKTVMQKGGKTPEQNQYYTLKMYLGQHVQGQHNLQHIQGDLLNDDPTGETPPSEPDAVPAKPKKKRASKTKKQKP